MAFIWGFHKWHPWMDDHAGNRFKRIWPLQSTAPNIINTPFFSDTLWHEFYSRIILFNWRFSTLSFEKHSEKVVLRQLPSILSSSDRSSDRCYGGFLTYNALFQALFQRESSSLFRVAPFLEIFRFLNCLFQHFLDLGFLGVLHAGVTLLVSNERIAACRKEQLKNEKCYSIQHFPRKMATINRVTYHTWIDTTSSASAA